LIDSFRKAGEGRQRMIAVYDYVRRTMKWNGEYRIFASNSPEKIFEKKTGYSSDINFQLINLLSRSGIPARPVLLSTRSNGPVYKELGFLRKFNHVIVSVELDGTRYLLDATDPNRPYNLLSTDDLNGEGLLVNLFEFQWVPLVNNGTTP
jgi:transglutaminase-like putative cysteine protease